MKAQSEMTAFMLWYKSITEQLTPVGRIRFNQSPISAHYMNGTPIKYLVDYSNREGIPY